MFIEKSEYKKILEEIGTLTRKSKEYEDIISGTGRLNKDIFAKNEFGEYKIKYEIS